MAPSTDEFLNYISESGSDVSLLLIVVNLVFLSAALLLSCASCYKFIHKEELDLMKNGKEDTNCQLTRTSVRLSNYTPSETGSNRRHPDAVPPDADRKKPENGSVPGTLGNGSVPGTSRNGSSAMTGRVLPRPPQDLPVPPPNPPATVTPPADDDPLYDSVNELQETPIPERVQTDNNLDENSQGSVPKAISSTTPQNGDGLKFLVLDRINPLYNSIDEMKEPPAKQEVPSVRPKPETREKTVEDTTLDPQSSLPNQPLYSIIRKKSIPNSPPQQITVSNRVNDTEQNAPITATSSTKLNMALNRTKERILKSKQTADSVVSFPDNFEGPPPIPDRCPDLEIESQQQTIKHDLETAIEMTT